MPAARDEPPFPPQVIPRPSGARPGGPAPWASLDPLDRRQVSVARVVAALRTAGLGGAVAPVSSPSAEHGVMVLDTAEPTLTMAPSAVLVALFEEGGEARVILTRRSARLRSHTSQVSFPGGRMEPGEDAAATARREAQEEIGLDGPLELVGWLHPVQTLASGSLISPVVAVLPARPHLVANPDEVDRIFDVALADLAADGVFHEERWSRPDLLDPASADGSFPVWFFEVAGETVWGATARMLYELVALAVDATTA